MKYVTLIITIPLTLFAALFALSNTAAVELSLWPLPLTYTTTINILGAAFLGAGFLAGALFVWFHSQKMRFQYWQERKKSARLEQELDLLHKKMSEAPSTSAALLT